jgi:hypothetical protein
MGRVAGSVMPRGGGCVLGSEISLLAPIGVGTDSVPIIRIIGIAIVPAHCSPTACWHRVPMCWVREFPNQKTASCCAARGIGLRLRRATGIGGAGRVFDAAGRKLCERHRQRRYRPASVGVGKLRIRGAAIACGIFSTTGQWRVAIVPEFFPEVFVVEFFPPSEDAPGLGPSGAGLLKCRAERLQFFNR